MPGIGAEGIYPWYENCISWDSEERNQRNLSDNGVIFKLESYGIEGEPLQGVPKLTIGVSPMSTKIIFSYLSNCTQSTKI